MQSRTDEIEVEAYQDLEQAERAEENRQRENLELEKSEREQ